MLPLQMVTNWFVYLTCTSTALILCRRAAQAVGVVSYGPGPHERQSLRHRRSLYFVRDLAAGSVIGEGDVRCIRPGLGLAPRFLPAVLGRHVSRAVQRGEAVAWDALG